MKLIVHELHVSIIQEIETSNNIILLESIRPHLYKHNNPAGSLFLEIRNLSNNLLFTSESVLISDIHAAAGFDFFHGVVDFPIQASLAKNTKYNIMLKSSGYTFSEAAYIGWCNGFDLKVVENSYTPLGDAVDSLIMEFWERKKLRKGQS